MQVARLSVIFGRRDPKNSKETSLLFTDIRLMSYIPRKKGPETSPQPETKCRLAESVGSLEASLPFVKERRNRDAQQIWQPFFFFFF